MSELENAREVLTAYDELVDSLRSRVAELEAALADRFALDRRSGMLQGLVDAGVKRVAEIEAALRAVGDAIENEDPTEALAIIKHTLA